MDRPVSCVSLGTEPRRKRRVGTNAGGLVYILQLELNRSAVVFPPPPPVF
jgi:hypothetical protein